jgi:hypothetical protein
MTLAFPNSAYADPDAAFTAPVLKTGSHKNHKLVQPTTLYSLFG